MNPILRAAAFCAVFLAASCAALPDASSDEARRAIAPTGRLRVALFEGSAVHAIKSPSGEIKGAAHDVGRKLAERLGVPFEPVLYPALGRLLDAGKAGEWDVAFLGANDERRRYFDFTGDYLQIEIGYLVPAGSAISNIADVDRSGVRVAVVERGSPEALLAPLLKNASLVRAKGLSPAVELVGSRKADVLAGQKPVMHGVAGRLPGSRVLDGTPASEATAMALPHGRGPAALAYATRFIEQAKADGTVSAAIERAGLRGAVVASAQ